MTVYAPGTLETDPKKQNIALQQQASKIAANTTSLATNTTNITTNTTNIATNTAAITALQTAGTGLANSGGSLAVSLSKITASLGADVALNASTYTDGPSVAQGTSGTWFVSGTVTVVDTSAARNINFKLWDGTTVIASCTVSTAGANFSDCATLSGFIASPAGNLRISCISASGTTAKLQFNQSGNSKDCTITAVRIA